MKSQDYWVNTSTVSFVDKQQSHLKCLHATLVAIARLNNAFGIELTRKTTRGKVKNIAEQNSSEINNTISYTGLLEENTCFHMLRIFKYDIEI